jgi:hypothetical protein
MRSLFESLKKINHNSNFYFEPYKDLLSVEEVKHICGYVGSKIESHFEEARGMSYTFENGQEWLIYKNLEEAEQNAIEHVKGMLQEEPENFNQEWLKNRYFISESNKESIAEAEGEAMKEFYDEGEIEDLLNRVGENHDEYEVASQEEKEKMVSKAMDTVYNETVEQVMDELDSPIEYFVETRGIYSLEDLLKQDFMEINVDNASQDAINIDGVAHFLSSYDGDEVMLANDMVMYRNN